MSVSPKNENKDRLPNKTVENKNIKEFKEELLAIDRVTRVTS